MQESSTEKLPLTDKQIMDGVFEQCLGLMQNDSETTEKETELVEPRGKNGPLFNKNR